MDKLTKLEVSPAAKRRDARIARGYSLEDLAVATGLTVAEISAAEDDDSTLPEHHAKRIEHALQS